MSTIPQASKIVPQRPWKASRKDLVETGSIFVFAALVSIVVVALTPLKGKLAYFVIFAIAYLAIDFVFHLRKAGRPAAVDSFFRGLVTMAILVAVTPILSILATVWIRGHKGCLLYTSPSPRDGLLSRMPSSA